MQESTWQGASVQVFLEWMKDEYNNHFIPMNSCSFLFPLSKDIHHIVEKGFIRVSSS